MRRAAKQIEITGCVDHNMRDKPPTIAVLTKDGKEKGYWLVGNTDSLQQAFFTPARIRGYEITQPAPTLGSAGPNDNGVIDVIEAKVFRPVAKMNSVFRDPSLWHKEANKLWGIRFAVPQPQTPPGTRAQREPWPEPSFVRQDGTETFARLEFPDLYPDANVIGIYFSASVNEEIDNSRSCEHFGREEAVSSLESIDGVKYAVNHFGGVQESVYNVHTLQNRLCYDLAFLFLTARTWPLETGCLIPTLSPGQETALIKTFLSQVRYSERTTSDGTQTGPSVGPEVTSFNVVPGEAGRAISNFSWTTRAADYVRLSFECSQSVLIFGNQQSALCGEPRIHYPPNFSSNLSPNSSLALSLTAVHKYDLSPVPVTVSMTPFSHGHAFPKSARSLTVDTYAFNPIPNGVFPAKQNIELTVPKTNGSGAARYAQGSSVLIKWKESAASRDSCMNLWLVRDSANGMKNYVLNIGRGCLSPAQMG